MPRKREKIGQRCSFYLTYRSIRLLEDLSKKYNKSLSSTLDIIIPAYFESKKSNMNQVLKEIDEVFSQIPEDSEKEVNNEQ